MSRRVQEVNICKIAEEAGVSAATVSRVINHRVGVGETTRRKVTELLARYQFTPDFPAMRTIRIAVILPYPHFLDYIRKALDGIYGYAQQHGLLINLMIANTPRRETLLEVIRDQQCSGVIALLCNRYRQQLDEVARTDLPLVLLDDTSEEPKTGYIDNDSFTGALEAMRYLIGLGHRKIGFLQRTNPCPNQVQRLQGYEEALREAGLKLDLSRVRIAPAEEGNEVRGMLGLRNMRRLLQQTPDLTAVFCVDDEVALGALTAVHESGRKIPGDFSVLGFDNSPETEAWFPALTTVDHPVEQGGRLAMERIHSALLQPGSWTPPHEVLPTRLIVRNSTGPVPNA